MFKKKKVEDAITNVQETSLNNDDKTELPKFEEPKKELTPEEKAKLEEVKQYQKDYADFMLAHDVANIPEVILRAEQINLSWALYREQKATNQLLKEIINLNK